MSAIKLILAVSIVVLFTTGTFAGELKGKDDVNKPVSEKTRVKDNSQKVKPVTVKNIWKDMPGYDRYGNEITARARYNMMQNESMNRNADNKSEDNSKEFSSNREVK